MSEEKQRYKTTIYPNEHNNKSNKLGDKFSFGQIDIQDNEYIPPQKDNNKGMVETIHNIIKNKQKVKVHGNEFDFSNYNEQTKKVSINGQEIQAKTLVCDEPFKEGGATTTIMLSDLENRDFYINVNGHNYNVQSITIYPDLTIKRIESVDTGARFGELEVEFNNFYNVDKDDNITGTTDNNSITIDFTDNKNILDDDVIQNIKNVILTTEGQKKLFDHFYNNKVKNNSSYGGSIYLTFYKNKLYVQQVIENDPKLLCIERHFDKNTNEETFTEKEYNLNNDTEEIVDNIFPIQNNKLVSKYRTKDDNAKQKNSIKLFQENTKNGVEAKLEMVSQQNLKENDTKDYICYKDKPSSMFVKVNDFDKKLKKYFDKCVEEEQTKEQEKQNKQNRDDKKNKNSLNIRKTFTFKKEEKQQNIQNIYNLFNPDKQININNKKERTNEYKNQSNNNQNQDNNYCLCECCNGKQNYEQEQNNQITFPSTQRQKKEQTARITNKKSAITLTEKKPSFSCCGFNC